MRELRDRVAATVVATVLVAGCTTAPQVDPPAGATTAPEAVDAVPAEVTADVDAVPLLEEYAELLQTVAALGPAELERVLRVSAADAYDPQCAPTWAHDLLDTQGAGEVQVADAHDEVSIGEVRVAVSVAGGRALHQGGACDAPLPQPPEPEPDPDPEPAPAPASPERTSPPSSPPTSPPRSLPTVPRDTVDPTTVATYDAELAMWANDIWLAFDEIIKAWQGMGGGRRDLETISYNLDDTRRYWERSSGPAGRREVNEALVEGLRWWALDVRWQAVCPRRSADPQCVSRSDEMAATWSEAFAFVTRETGIAMPRP